MEPLTVLTAIATLLAGVVCWAAWERRYHRDVAEPHIDNQSEDWSSTGWWYVRDLRLVLPQHRERAVAAIANNPLGRCFTAVNAERDVVTLSTSLGEVAMERFGVTPVPYPPRPIGEEAIVLKKGRQVAVAIRASVLHRKREEYFYLVNELATGRSFKKRYWSEDLASKDGSANAR